MVKALRNMVTAGSFFWAMSVLGHHNSAPLFDFDRLITIEGVVTEFRFLNPHARIRLRVTDDDGNAIEWEAEGANVIALRLNGWTGSEMRPGDEIEITGAPARDDSPRMEWREVRLEDGTVLGGGNNFRKESDELFDDLERRRQN